MKEKTLFGDNITASVTPYHVTMTSNLKINSRNVIMTTNLYRDIPISCVTTKRRIGPPMS